MKLYFLCLILASHANAETLSFNNVWVGVGYLILTFGIFGVIKIISEYTKVIARSLEAIKRYSTHKIFTSIHVYGAIKDDLPEDLQKQEKFDKVRNICEFVLKQMSDAGRIKQLHIGHYPHYLYKEGYIAICDQIEYLSEDLKDGNYMINRDALIQELLYLEIELDAISGLLLLQENLTLLKIKDKSYYVCNIDLEHFNICGSYQQATLKIGVIDGDEAEWFCSDTCRETEEHCQEIINDETIEEYYEKIFSQNVWTALNTLFSAQTWTQNFKPLSNSQTGHGWSAEIMNDKLDRLSGKEAHILGNDNAKNGADRIVNGEAIQTKYCNTPTKSINAAFDHKSDGNFKYLNQDGTPMQIEVPKDQYDKAVGVMEQKIQEGKVPGITNPDEAKNIVRKGNVTYQEAKNYAKFCTQESLKFDAMTGSIVALCAAGISFTINTAICFYRGGDIKKAMQESVIIGISSGGKAFAIHMISAQAQRIPAVANFLKSAININFGTGSKMATALSNVGGGTKQGLSVSNAATTTIRSTVVVAAATLAVTSSIEIMQMMRGRISGMQCVKNIAINSASIAGGSAGALAGAALGSVILPGVGTFVGGLIGGMAASISASMLAKISMDSIIEDDITKKQRLFFEHMILLATLFKLSKEEADVFKNMVDEIVQKDKNFFNTTILIKEIIPSSNRVLKPLIVLVLKKRPRISQEVFANEAYIIEAIQEVA